MFKKEYLILFSLFFILLCINPCNAAIDDAQNATNIQSELDDSSLLESTEINDICSQNSSDFSANVTEGINSLDVQFNYSSTDYDSIMWDFGDGNNSDEQNPIHYYDKVGSYNVSLNVIKSGESNTILKTNFIHVYKECNPIVNANCDDGLSSGWITNGYTVRAVTGANAHSGTALALYQPASIEQLINFDVIDSLDFWKRAMTNGINLNVYIDDDLVYVNSSAYREWVLKNINTSNIHGFHLLKFVSPNGTYVIDDINVNYVDVLSNFSIKSININNDEINVNFNSESLGLISNWLWDFGDGNTSTEENPTHTFAPGNYKVSLTVSNANYNKTYGYDLSLLFPTINGKMYNNVQEAVDNASAGDVIDISVDLSENILINTSLTLNFNGFKLSGDGFAPLIKVTDGAEVTVKNMTATGNNNVFNTDASSKLTIMDSNVNDANITLAEGNINLYAVSFNNSYVTISNASAVISNSNVANGAISVNGGKSKITNSVLSGNNVAVSQIAGESEITGNIITQNTVGVNVTGGKSTVSFNAIYDNTNGNLVYAENVTATNNWYGTNNPTTSGTESYLLLLITAPTEMYADDEYTICIDLTKNGEGQDTSSLGTLPTFNLTVTSNGGSILAPVTIENGKTEFKLATCSNTVENVEFTILGENYPTMDGSSIVAKPIETTLTITSSEKTVVVITLKDIDGNPISGANIIYYINNNNATNSTDANGTIVIKDLKGAVTVKADYAANKVYNASSNTASFTFTEQTNIVASNLTVVYNDGKSLTATLNDEKGNPISNQNIIIVINGESVNKTTDGNGQVSLPIALAPNNYNANISFNGDNYYLASSASVTVVVNKLASKLTAGQVSTTYNVAKNLVVTLKDSNGNILVGKKVTVKVGTISKTLTTNSKGQVSVNVATLAPKTYTATISFDGDNYYIKSSASAKVTVAKATPKITAAKKTFKVKTKTKKYVVTLKTNKNAALKKAKVTLKVNGKNYKATTDSKGKATFKITKLTKKGTFTATVKFAGNNYYKAISKKVKLTVKK